MSESFDDELFFDTGPLFSYTAEQRPVKSMLVWSHAELIKFTQTSRMHLPLILQG